MGEPRSPSQVKQLEEKIRELESENRVIKRENRDLKDENKNLRAQLQILVGSRGRLPRDTGLHKEVLTKRRTLLIHNLHPTHPIDVLRQEKNISAEQAAEILAGGTRQEKNRRLVDFLHTRGYDCFDVFLQSLKEDNDDLWSNLTDKLEDLCKDQETTTYNCIQCSEDSPNIQSIGHTRTPKEPFGGVDEVDSSPSLHTKPWYFPDVDRTSAEGWLQKEEPGTFLVRRQTKKSSASYVVTIRNRTEVIHVKIQRMEDGKYNAEGLIAESVPKIIDHLMKKNLRSNGEDVQLSRPFVRKPDLNK